jgi:hypothetical protein
MLMVVVVGIVVRGSRRSRAVIAGFVLSGLHAMARACCKLRALSYALKPPHTKRSSSTSSMCNIDLESGTGCIWVRLTTRG